MRVLSQTDRRKVAVVIILQICLSVLDLFGVLAIGLFGALSVFGLPSTKPGDRVNSALQLLPNSNF